MLRIGIEGLRILRKKKHGIDHVAIELIRELSRQELDFELFVFCFKGDYHPEDIPDNPRVRFITLPRYPSPVAEQLLLPLLVKRYRLDLLHSTGNTAPFFLPCKSIITLHDIIYLEPKADQRSGSLYQRLGNLYRSLVVPFVIRKAHRIVTVSEAERDIIEKRFPELSRNIRVIPNSCPEYLGESATISHPVPYGLNTKGYYFHLGNTDPKKNTERLLIACFSLMKTGKLHFPLVIADLSISNIQRLIYKNNLQGIESMLIPVGYLNHREIAAYYQHSRLFIYPGLRESFGIPMLEAMAFGTPVIAGDIQALKEVGADAAVYADPMSAESIASSIRNLEANTDLREQLVMRGYRRFNDYSWKESVQKLMAIYKNRDTVSFKKAMAIKKGKPEAAPAEKIIC